MATASTIRCLELLLLEEKGTVESVTALAKRFDVTRRTIFRDRALVRKAKCAFELRTRAPENGNAKGKPKKQSRRNTNQD